MKIAYILIGMENIFKSLILPSNLIILFFLTGIILFLIRKVKKYGSYLLIIATIIYIFFATGPISFWLLGNLEYQYPYLKDTALIKDVNYIVVLSAYADNDLNLPISSRVNASAAFRLMEAQKLHREIPGTKIIITGAGEVPDVMKEVLISMGVKENKITVENRSGNTYDSLKNLKTLIGDKKFVLVTSAGHMPRSIGISNKMGLNPIPAPTDYLTFKNYMAISYLPSPLHLINSDLAIHEYVAIFWYRLKQRM